MSAPPQGHVSRMWQNCMGSYYVKVNQKVIIQTRIMKKKYGEGGVNDRDNDEEILRMMMMSGSTG